MSFEHYHILREECELLISESKMLQKIFEHGKD